MCARGVYMRSHIYCYDDWGKLENYWVQYFYNGILKRYTGMYECSYPCSNIKHIAYDYYYLIILLFYIFEEKKKRQREREWDKELHCGAVMVNHNFVVVLLRCCYSFSFVFCFAIRFVWFFHHTLSILLSSLSLLYL